MSVDLQIHFFDYMKSFLKKIDGQMWAFVSLATFILLIDVLAATNLAPLREQEDLGKALVLLAFSPLLLFLVITVLQQLPFSSGRFSSWMRALICLGAFLILNF